MGEPAIRVMMMPRDTNAHGTIFGGHILSIIDQAGAIAAHAAGVGKVVTVAIHEVIFRHPVHVGDVVSCYTEIVGRGRTSITVLVKVFARNPLRGSEVEVTSAELVYVHIDEEGRPAALSATP